MTISALPNGLAIHPCKAHILRILDEPRLGEPFAYHRRAAVSGSTVHQKDPRRQRPCTVS